MGPSATIVGCDSMSGGILRLLSSGHASIANANAINEERNAKKARSISGRSRLDLQADVFALQGMLSPHRDERIADCRLERRLGRVR